jgi:hypothetical protein
MEKKYTNCPSCGGIIGRDCFNPIECAWITQQINAQYAVDDFVSKMNADYEREKYEKIELEYYNAIELEHIDYIATCTLESNPVLSRFLTTI